jgi:signal transduction histidine kinase/ActR/RegA family two-component response regulator
MRLRGSLFALSAATVLPVLGFALLAAALVVRQQNDDLRDVAQTRNRATLTAVDAELRGVISTLHAVTDVRELKIDDIRGFHEYAQGLLRTHNGWQNVILHDADGAQIANARLPWGTELLKKPVEPRTLDAARLERRTSITDLIHAPLLGNELGISVRVPIVRGTRVVYVLTAVVKPATFQALLAQQEMPNRWVSGLVDGRGQLIARVPTIAPGSPASEDYLRRVRDADEGWYRGRTLEGNDTYTAFLKSPLTGWSIGFAIPSDAVVGSPLRAVWLMGSGIALSLIGAVLIVLWLSERIVGPMRELAQAATALGSGKTPTAVASDIDEVKLVSVSLVKAGEAIAARDHELHKTDAELRQQTAELLQADANKRRFLAVLGHELRNPLAPLRNGLAILKKTSDNAVRGDVQAMMERQVTQMTRLIEDLLDVHRIDRGQLELRREIVAIDSVVRNAVDTVRPALESKRQTLELKGCEEPLHVDADFVRLSQVLANLLSNASKFSPSGSTVKLETRRQAGSVVLTVKDTGEGFDPGNATRIFDLFVQLDSGGTKSSGGLGIGLTIAKSIVELHGGTIRAHSDGSQRGATFTVCLPLVHAAAPPHPDVDTASATAVGVKRRVLVVDDNVDAANSLAEVLRLEGYEVQACYAGAQALEAAQLFQPNVAFLDLNMPEMSGFELMSALRSMPWASRLKVYAVTGMGQKADLAQTLVAGFEGHLTKPVAPDAVVRLAAGATDNVVPMIKRQ